MRYTTSAVLGGTRHGFSTRRGGFSTGRYASLNLGRNWGDDLTRVDENLRLLAAAAGFDEARLYTAKQVHGAVCLSALDVASAADPAALRPREADALVATVPGTTAGIYTADCVPILFSDGHGRVAAAHAGWRGTAAGIAAVTVEALVAAGATRAHIRAAVGPSIGPCCFEVGEEVAAVFERLHLPGAVTRATGKKPHVDLQRINRALLERAGLLPDHIDAAPPCTMCHPDRYYSFRRDGAGIGQMLSFVVAEAMVTV